jgi:acyl carrier protein
MNPTLKDIIEPLLNDKYSKKGITSEDKIPDILEDSLACTQLLFDIDEYLGILIPDGNFQEMKTIGDLEAYIQKHQPKQTCASQ